MQEVYFLILFMSQEEDYSQCLFLLKCVDEQAMNKYRTSNAEHCARTQLQDHCMPQCFTQQRKKYQVVVLRPQVWMRTCRLSLTAHRINHRHIILFSLDLSSCLLHGHGGIATKYFTSTTVNSKQKLHHLSEREHQEEEHQDGRRRPQTRRQTHHKETGCY